MREGLVKKGGRGCVKLWDFGVPGVIICESIHHMG